MNTKLTLLTGVLTIGLAACNPEPKTEAPTDEKASSSPAAAIAVQAKGTGTVTAIDAAANKITIGHGPIAELDWPAMKMGFAASPEMLTAVKSGDKVAFDFEWDGKEGKITSISPSS